MSRLLDLLDVAPVDEDVWQGRASGPEGKRAYGGQLVAQSLAAAARTVEAAKAPTAMHLQFLRGGDAGATVDYRVHRVFVGRTAASRRVDAAQDGRLLTTATVSFSAPLPGPEHGHVDLGADPETLPRTGPAGPGTTDSSMWFHRELRADGWNLLECRSPAAGRGRGVVTASLIRCDGDIAATLTQEGLIAEREPAPDPAS